jgi:UDP-glucuronate 4-epimerase
VTILVTGSAGFIGAAVAERLLREGEQVVGVDCLDPYYDVQLKRARLERLGRAGAYRHEDVDLCDRAATEALFARCRPRLIVHLAAQPGVRYAAVNPHVYVRTNVDGFLHVLEGARTHRAAHVVFASSSSVYGANSTLPFSVHQSVHHPLSLYAATKLAGEAMAHSYAHLYRVPLTGLRFFTVYGPWGRPDMAPIAFARAIRSGDPISLFQSGEGRRDFTFIDDVVEVVVRALRLPPTPNAAFDRARPDPAISDAPYRLYDVGNRAAVRVRDFVALLEAALGKSAHVIDLPAQAGDLEDTLADSGELERDFGFRPDTRVERGIADLVRWLVAYDSHRG